MLGMLSNIELAMAVHRSWPSDKRKQTNPIHRESSELCIMQLGEIVLWV